MDEKSFWTALEFRVCREFGGMTDRQLRYYWCDGFTVQDYVLENEEPRIVGRAWIGKDAEYEEWNFTLFLPGAVESHEEIQWEALLPAENVTNWLAVDPEHKRMQIEPRAAVLDLA
jgi:hypothetical protein